MFEKKSIVLLSGYGSNFKNILEKIKLNYLPMDIVAVISDNPNANGLALAKKENIKTYVINSNNNIGDEIEKIIIKSKIDLIILAGFMKILPESFVRKYSGKILNIHPSLLPKYKGMHTHKKVLENKDINHGASVHFVTSELDGGPVIIQSEFIVSSNHNEEDLKMMAHKVEYEIYPIAIKWFLDGILSQSERSFSINKKVYNSPIQHIILK
tara:strand:- start:62 stop:697 length:636 start_codon:yes stop_codon:yes gene_type:complete